MEIEKIYYKLKSKIPIHHLLQSQFSKYRGANSLICPLESGHSYRFKPHLPQKFWNLLLRSILLYSLFDIHVSVPHTSIIPFQLTNSFSQRRHWIQADDQPQHFPHSHLSWMINCFLTKIHV